MGNKKAFLLAEQTLKIIIALIGILALIYLLTSLYFNKVQAENQAAAYNSLHEGNKVKGILKELSTKEDQSTISLDIIKPVGWYLFTFTGTGSAREQRPNLCQGKNCLCICANEWVIFGSERKAQAIECDDAGACLIIDNPDTKLKLVDYSKDLEEIEILNPRTRLTLKKEGDNVRIIV